MIELIPWYIWALFGLVVTIYIPYIAYYGKNEMSQPVKKVTFVLGIVVGVFIFIDNIFIGMLEYSDFVKTMYVKYYQPFAKLFFYFLIIIFISQQALGIKQVLDSNASQKEKNKKIIILTSAIVALISIILFKAIVIDKFI